VLVADTTLKRNKDFSDLFYSVHRIGPRLDTYGHIDARLRYLLKGMKNVGPAANRVKPMPIHGLHLLQSVLHGKDDRFQAYADAAYMEFFFQTSKNKPILLRNTTFRNDGY
jgi:hypothetical protein